MLSTRSDFAAADNINIRFRTKLDAALRQSAAVQVELSRSAEELSKAKKQSEESTEERDTIKSVYRICA
jgi:hypothetical protein